MGLLTHLATGNTHTLTSAFQVGRQSRCSLVLDDLLVSAEHAAFHWVRTGWELRDLHSSNGTFVDGRRLDPGERVMLSRGMRVAFGDAGDAYELGDDGPPVPGAVGLDGQTADADEDGVFIPHQGDAECIVFEDEGVWYAQTAQDPPVRVADGEHVQVAGQSWQLELPVVQEPTRRPDSRPLTPGELTLSFAVSRDEENIDITTDVGLARVSLEHQANSGLLLLLARARLQDRDEGLSRAEEGWRYTDEVARMLGITERQLNVLTHRARKRFDRAGVARAHDIVERRTGSRQIRLGAHELKVEEPG